MSKETNVIKINGGVAIPLLCIFVTLKLTHQVDWSWLWVLSPLWLPLAVALGFVACIGLFLLLAACIAAFSERS